jgi:hypothetical protein
LKLHEEASAVISCENAPREGSTTQALEKAAAFAEDVARTVEVEGIVNIFNVDQTAVFYEMLPKTMLDPTGSRVKCGR